jgi:hypothetical protein
MAVIEAEHYRETRLMLHADMTTTVMALDVLKFHNDDATAALEAVSHPETRTPRHEFMLQANNGYRALGGKVENKHLGAVAEVIIAILIVAEGN